MTKEPVIANSAAATQSRPDDTAATAPRAKLQLSQPAVLLATWFGVGLLPLVPGTWGSLAALPAAWAIRFFWGNLGLSIAVVAVFALGCWAASAAEAASGRTDPGAIVIDEVAAQFLALLAAPPSGRGYLAAFILFRLFDITKPFPIKSVERAMPSGLGIMLDDILAALYAVIVLLLVEGGLGVRL